MTYNFYISLNTLTIIYVQKIKSDSLWIRIEAWDFPVEGWSPYFRDLFNYSEVDQNLICHNVNYSIR